MHSYGRKLKLKSAESPSPVSPWKKVARKLKRRPESNACRLFSLVKGLCWTTHFHLEVQPVEHFMLNGCVTLRLAIRRKEPQILQRGIILFQQNAARLFHYNFQTLPKKWDETSLHIFYISRPCVLRLFFPSRRN
jgi:hypothetical protein